MYNMEYAGHWKLKNVNPGSIYRLPGGSLALMTEYGDNDGFRHSYLLGSGESCWADLDTEVIVLDVVDDGSAKDYLKPSDEAHAPHRADEIPLEKVPQANRDFAAGDMDAFDKPKPHDDL